MEIRISGQMSYSSTGNYRPINLTSVPGKVMEKVLLETITNSMTQMTGKSQYGFTSGKTCQTRLIAFYNKRNILSTRGEQQMLFTWTSAKHSALFPTAFSWSNSQDTVCSVRWEGIS